MPLPCLVRHGVGWLLTVVGVLLVPVCWVAAGIHHAMTCPSFFLCAEPLLGTIAHVLAITATPPLALLLFAVGDELRHRR